ncbi:Nijmegen breakage syndrome 1, putative isoform 2 [Hibiscus syriacus]|uniref:Nijmegen breakage syndrome 1, putative isoform 2 n=2 Tax=Hibiscus syriacus TaxID=106335 RepID=A0A6A2XSU7_HIBSY|nr:Nijmegen breakage syndrome 1, putative isoform 2 [Hibiscus syriacus]
MVDEMTQSSQVTIKDLSKYGTFINKNLTSNKKVHQFPNKQTSLEDGDLLSFGTGNATLRFSYAPLVFYICCAEASQMSHYLQDKVSSIGARLIHAYNEDCTHVIVDQHMPLQRDLLDAIVAKKPLLHTSWLELVADKSIHTEFPDCLSHVPKIMVDGVFVEVADPKTRENCLGGYTFLLESSHVYNFGDRLQSLLEVSGSRVIWVKDICSNNQAFERGENTCCTYVVPGRSADKFDRLDKLGLSYRVDEMALIRALLSGKLDHSILISSSVPVSSCSTDETVVADLEEENETATTEEENETATSVNANDTFQKEGAHTYVNRGFSMESPSYVSTAEVSICHETSKLEGGIVTSKDDNCCLTAKRYKADEAEYGSSKIFYSQVLKVRDVNVSSKSSFKADNGVKNYKRFRKASIQSGNSFSNLVPFSKYPYKDYEFGSGELAESVKEEKRRKKMDAIADDMFNEKGGRQRGLSGSVRRGGLHMRG